MRAVSRRLARSFAARFLCFSSSTGSEEQKETARSLILSETGIICKGHAHLAAVGESALGLYLRTGLSGQLLFSLSSVFG